MKLPRRKFLHLAAGTAALPSLSRFAWAQAYPTRPVRLIVGFAPGGQAQARNIDSIALSQRSEEFCNTFLSVSGHQSRRAASSAWYQKARYAVQQRHP